MQGRIIKLISNDYTVLSNGERHVCKSRGKFRNMNISPLVGDFVEFDLEKGYIINSNQLENILGITSDFEEVKLGKDEYFVLGDNRLVSEDSRSFGIVKEKYIEGEANFIIYPFNKFGKVS